MKLSKPYTAVKNILESEKWGNLAEYVIIFLVILISFILCRNLGIKNDADKTRTLMLAAFSGLALYAIYTASKGQMNSEKAVKFIIIAGIIMRVGYMVYTHMFARGHDLGTFEANGVGHIGYIFNLAENGSLPASNEYQLYHPPFFHIMAALFIRIGALLHNSNIEDAFEYSQIVNCVVSCFMIVAFKNFINQSDINKKYRPYVVAIIAFFPNFYLMAGRLNNDMLVSYFMLLCVINTYRWYRNRNIKNVICLALSFGFGMMSKVSCGTIAIFTGPVMLYCLIKEIRGKNTNSIKEIIFQLCVFAAICLPLALWYPLRNYILFGQPLNYVTYIGDNSFVYTGNVSLFRRFFDFSPVKLFTQPFANVNDDYSIPMHMVRSAIYGEFSFDGYLAFFSIFSIVNLCLIIVSLASMVFVLIKGKGIPAENKYGMFFLWIITVVSFIAFNISYPFICTADFRYVPLTAVTGAVLMTYGMQYLDSIGKKNHADLILHSEKILITVWCILSCITFI